MFGRVAAFSCAVLLIVVWPAHAGSDPVTLVEPQPVSIQFVPTVSAITQQPSPNAGDDVTKAESESEGGVPTTKLDGAEAAASNIAYLGPAEPATRLSLAGPFALGSIPITAGAILDKWRGVTADIRTNKQILARCQDGAPCPQAAQRFLAIVAQGRAQNGLARIGIINRAINLAIKPMSDLAQWGVVDRWSAPLETFTTGRGDCEDYAIAKYVALTEAGVAAADVKLIVVLDTATDENHVIVAVRLDGCWITLDNRWLSLVPDSEMRQVLPLFVLDETGVRQFMPAATISAKF
jgi:predicted transglutaminase-like cysteine proteinase